MLYLRGIGVYTQGVLMNKASKSQAKYDAKATKRYSLKLNLKNDKKIIEKLASEKSMQGYIKRLITQDINASLFMKVLIEKNAEGYVITGFDKKDDGLSATMEKDDGAEKNEIKVFEEKDPIKSSWKKREEN